MVWKETDPEQTAVDLVPADEVPATGWKQVLEGEDQNGRTVALIQEDTPALRRMAVFDVLVNNADRKGDHKLRTALWGWIGEALSAEEIASLAARCARLCRTGRFPAPSGGMPAVPWPLF